MPKNDLAKYFKCFALPPAGQQTTAAGIFGQMKEDAQNRHVKPSFLVLAAVATGRIDEALDFLNRRLKKRIYGCSSANNKSICSND